MQRIQSARVALRPLVAAALVVAASPAHAFDLGITILGTVGGVDMQNVNNVLKSLNAQYVEDMQPVRFESIGTAAGYGVGLHTPLGDRLLIGAEWERLVASSAVGGPLDRNTIRTNADIYRASVAVDLIPENKFRFGVEAGVGYLSSAAEQTIFEQDVQVLSTALDGSGAAYNASLFFAVPATPTLDFSVGIGYRVAKLDNLDYYLTTNIDGAEPQPLSSLDWTGVYGRAAVTIYVL